ncbi:MAG TPA: leishmanolysin-related zinc metalloendopeptidase [Gemmatimonadales bacterium]|nr:leishmanolysin-related zinc metalloendopeptidase [Gemmatimonadales bacterium]
MPVRRRSRSTVVALCALALVASCSSKSPTQQPTVGAVGVSPAALNFATLNATHQLTATVTDQSGSPINGASVTWSSSNIAVTLVNSGGLVTAVGDGVDTVTATSGSKSGKVVVTVSQVAASVVKQGGDGQGWATSATLPQPITVKVVDSGGSPVTLRGVTFAVVTGGGSIVEHSAFTDQSGLAAVHWTLGGTVGSQSASATVSPAPFATFTATASAAGTATQIATFAGDGQTGLDTYALNFAPAVIVKDAAGLPVSGVSVTFAVASGGGSVTGGTTTTSSNGVATVGSWVVQDGANTLTATAAPSGISSNPVTFNATGQAANYPIELHLIGTFDATAQAAADSASARWARIIYVAGEPIPFNIGAGACFSPKTTAVNETVNGVVIFLVIDSIDGSGKVLAQAGPCYVRSDNRLPIAGLIEIDSSDVAFLEGQGELGEVILHEMAHILGFGTIWDPGDLALVADPAESGGTDPHFIGTLARGAFYGMGGLNYTGGAVVPVEDSGGPGTADGHWRERVFHTELMTGFLNIGVPNPLSVLTIASMGDMGYTVNYAAAQSYTQTFSERLGGASGAPIHLVNDILHGPLYMMSRAGKVMGVIQR